MNRIVGMIFSLTILLAVQPAGAALPAAKIEAELSTLAPYASADTARLSKVLVEGTEAWGQVKDYEAEFLKQETSEGKPGLEEKIFLKFEKPFKIFLGWLNTHKKGLQVFYERGEHDGKLAIHKPGLMLGLAPVVFLDQNSPWVKEGSASFDIEDAGIGTFLDSFSEDVIEAEKQKKLRTRILQDDSAGLLAEVEFSDSHKGDGFMARRVEVFFDAVSKLPTRMALFDEAGTLIGRYAYEKLVLNTGAQSSVFQGQAFRKLFKLYTHTDDRARVKRS